MDYETDKSAGWDEMVTWLSGLERWHTFLTLTFRDIETPDVARRYWRGLVSVLNRDAFGKHYVRRVGHSYFSYALALEYQERGAVHFHAIVNRSINYDLVHRWWNHACGFAWIQPVEKVGGVAGYVCKYVSKSAYPDLYIAGKRLVPYMSNTPRGKVSPLWYKDTEH